jgi:hypothetical protein
LIEAAPLPQAEVAPEFVNIDETLPIVNDSNQTFLIEVTSQPDVLEV